MFNALKEEQCESGLYQKRTGIYLISVYLTIVIFRNIE